MQLVLNLEKETVEDLSKAITILEKVIYNRHHNLFFADGLDAYQPKPSVPTWLMAEEKKRQDSVRLAMEEKQRQQQEIMRAPVERYPQSATSAVDESKLTSAAAQKLLEQKRMMETVDLSILLKRK